MKTVIEPIQKSFSADVKISPDDTRTVVATISTSIPDRENEVLVPSGMNAKDWQKNPVVMINHSYSEYPVGKVVGLTRTEKAIIAKVQFPERPENHPENVEWPPDTIFSLFKQGVLNAFSVGFLPVEGRVPSEHDKEIYGEDCKYIFSKWNVLEVSVVGIPCNPEAVVMAVSKGLIKQESANKLFKLEDKKEEQKEVIEKVLEIIEDLNENIKEGLVEPVDNILPADLTLERIEKTESGRFRMDMGTASATINMFNPNEKDGGQIVMDVPKNCVGCLKEFKPDEMTQDEDGDWYCAKCMSEKSLPAKEVIAEVTLEEDESKSLTAVKQVISDFEMPVVEESNVKVICVNYDPADFLPSVPVRKQVNVMIANQMQAKIAKLRGRIIVTE